MNGLRAGLLLAGAVACGPEPEKTGTAGVDDTGLLPGSDGGGSGAPPNCPAGMLEVPGGTFTLGEWDPDQLERYPGQILKERSYTLDPFCVDELPFPGLRGAPWPTDALDWDIVVAFEAELPAYGRRLCTTAELLHAAAGPDNWRYPYDDLQHSPGTCEGNDLTPSAPLGSFSACVSPYGLLDLNVRSAWTVFDAQAGEDLRAFYQTDTGGTLIPGGGLYAVWGGSANQGTFFPPNNFGVHFYGPDDPGYVNESIRTCAAVGPAPAGADEAWAALVQDFTEDPTWAGLGLGR